MKEKFMLAMKARNIFALILFFVLNGCAVLGPDNDRDNGSSGGNGGFHDGANRPVNLAVSPENTKGSLWLAKRMDQYHSVFYVFDDMNSAGNHFPVLARMGDPNSVMNQNDQSGPYTGSSAIKVTFNPKDSKTGNFLSATQPDGKPNTTVLVVNAQTAPMLSLKLSGQRYTNGLVFAESNHRVDSYGFDFNTDKDGYWYEGMANMAMAYLYTGLSSKAGSVISLMNSGQAASGAMYAANKDNLTTGYEWSPGNPLYISKKEHAGTTAWKLLLDKRKNPYWNDALPGTAASGATAGYSYLTNDLNQFHNKFDVYTDLGKGGNHFYCYAGMGTVPSLDLGVTSVKYSGDTAIKATSGGGWGGYYFMNGYLDGSMTAPAPNWGDLPYPSGVYLTGASNLTFYAKGASGNEQVEFFCGGVGRDPDTGNPTKTYPDSLTKTSINVTLSTSWTKYTINVAGKNLDNVLGGFGFVIKQPNKTIYIDQIQYDQKRTEGAWFLTSYPKTDLSSGKDFDKVNRQVCYTYDNALALLSLLACGDTNNAGKIADALVYASQHDRSYSDYRLRNAYASGDLHLWGGWAPNGKQWTARLPNFPSGTTVQEDSYAVGTCANTMAWSIIALLTYYQKAGGSDYLNTAKNLGDWVENNLKAPDGGYYAGFTGWEPNPAKDTAKVVEHNSALYAAFSRLYSLTSDSKWNTRAAYAKNYVLSMWGVGTGWYCLNGTMNSDPTNYTPQANWGDTPNAGMDLSGASKLTFYAKGAKGNEKVEFFCGGVGRDVNTGSPIKPYPDSMPKVSSGLITLSSTWTKYTIDISGQNASYVLGGFGFWLNSPNTNQIVFYIDDIKYDKPRLNEPRFIVSYQTIPGTNAADVVLKNTSYVYDNCVAIMALLAAGENDRARLIADALIYAQNHDRYYNDGRLRNAYMGGDLTTPNGWIVNGKTGTVRMPGFWWDSVTNAWLEDDYMVSSDTGNMAWAMLAWLACYNMLGDIKYLEAAKTLGNWIEDKLKDTRPGAAGYKGQFYGWEPNPDPRQYKSNEHNFDLYAAFTRLYQITGETKWKDRADWARSYCMSLWDETRGIFYQGSSDNNVIYNDPKVDGCVFPLDCQTWTLLSMNDLVTNSNYFRGLSYAESHCKYGDTWGFDFNMLPALWETVCPDGIWYEGTAGAALAYMLTGQWQKASNVINTIAGGYASDGGIYACGPEGINSISTGFWTKYGEWRYFRRECVCATSWGVLVDKRVNPYWFGTSGGVIQESATPGIVFTYVPPKGNNQNVQGKVSGVIPSNYKVALYIYVPGWGWVSKPYAASPYTSIKSDSTWSNKYATGGSDTSATIIAAFLSPVAYNPPFVNAAGSLPAELYSNCPAYAQTNR